MSHAHIVGRKSDDVLIKLTLQQSWRERRIAGLLLIPPNATCRNLPGRLQLHGGPTDLKSPDMIDDDQQPTSRPRVIYSSGRAEDRAQPEIRILHYNDVYHVDESSSEPVGGFPRFITLCREYQEGQASQGLPKVLTLFSGDAFNPSLESSVTKGPHLD